MNLPPELLADRRLGHAAVRVACALWALASVVDGRAVCLALLTAVASRAGVSADTVANQIHPGRKRPKSLVAAGWIARDPDSGLLVLIAHVAETASRGGRNVGATGRGDHMAETASRGGRGDQSDWPKRPVEVAVVTSDPMGGEGGGVSPAFDLPPAAEPLASARPSAPQASLFEEPKVMKPKSSAKRRPRSRGVCTDQEWAEIAEAYQLAQKVAGNTRWGALDCDSNRRLVAKILVEWTMANWREVIAHSGRMLAQGENPRWHTMTFMERKFAERIELARAGAHSAPRGGPHSMEITLKNSERDPTPEELENDQELQHALRGQR